MVPVYQKFLLYYQRVNSLLLSHAYQSKANETNFTLRKNVRNAQVDQTLYILVVSANEVEGEIVHVRL